MRGSSRTVGLRDESAFLLSALKVAHLNSSMVGGLREVSVGAQVVPRLILLLRQRSGGRTCSWCTMTHNQNSILATNTYVPEVVVLV